MVYHSLDFKISAVKYYLKIMLKYVISTIVIELHL